MDKTKAQSFLKVILPEVIFFTSRFHLRYEISSKYSDKLGKVIYIIHFVVYSNLKVANVPLLYKANKEAVTKLVELTNKLNKETIPLFYVFEFKKSINFIPDRNMHEETVQFFSRLKANSSVEIIGGILITNNEKRKEDISRTQEVFSGATTPKLIIAMHNTYEEALKTISRI